MPALSRGVSVVVVTLLWPWTLKRRALTSRTRWSSRPSGAGSCRAVCWGSTLPFLALHGHAHAGTLTDFATAGASWAGLTCKEQRNGRQSSATVPLLPPAPSSLGASRLASRFWQRTHTAVWRGARRACRTCWEGLAPHAMPSTNVSTARGGGSAPASPHGMRQLRVSSRYVQAQAASAPQGCRIPFCLEPLKHQLLRSTLVLLQIYWRAGLSTRRVRANIHAYSGMVVALLSWSRPSRLHLAHDVLKDAFRTDPRPLHWAFVC